MNQKLAGRLRQALHEMRIPLAPVYVWIGEQYGSKNLTDLTDSQAMELLEALPAKRDAFLAAAQSRHEARRRDADRVAAMKRAMTDDEKTQVDIAFRRARQMTSEAHAKDGAPAADELAAADAAWRQASMLEMKILAKIAARLRNQEATSPRESALD